MLSALSITGEQVTQEYDMAALPSAILATSLVITVKEFSKLMHWVTKECMPIKISILEVLDTEYTESESDPIMKLQINVIAISDISQRQDSAFYAEQMLML